MPWKRKARSLGCVDKGAHRCHSVYIDNLSETMEKCRLKYDIFTSTEERAPKLDIGNRTFHMVLGM